MKLQRYNHPWCGPTALQNALRGLGLFINQYELVHLCDTDDDGTDEKGLQQAIERLPVEASEISSFNPWEAIATLDQGLRCGKAAVICVDNFDHWVAVIGRLGSRYIVIDSTNEEWNTREQGCWSVSVQDLVQKWKASPTAADGEAPFYGLLIERS